MYCIIRHIFETNGIGYCKEDRFKSFPHWINQEAFLPLNLLYWFPRNVLEHLCMRDKLYFVYPRQGIAINLTKPWNDVSPSLLRIAKWKLLCGWQNQNLSYLTLLHHPRPLWHKCLMRWEIFSRWKVISVSVCECVSVLMCVIWSVWGVDW